MPSREGETRAAYVIQRHFRLVRKGYDPAEVDRHLELVSEWFRISSSAQKTRELGKQSAARERAAADREAQAERFVESSRLEAEATLEGARLLLARAQEEAEQTRAAARVQAAEIVDQARLEAAAADVIREAEERRNRSCRAREWRPSSSWPRCRPRLQTSPALGTGRRLQSYVERRHREVDRLVQAARRERQRSGGDASDD